MKATEFVKKYGWERAKREVTLHGWLNTGFWMQLKNLVNAYELVEKHGGLEISKHLVNIGNYKNLQDAVLLVESCTQSAFVVQCILTRR